MKKMKKFFAIGLTLALTLSLMACGGETGKEPAGSNDDDNTPAIETGSNNDSNDGDTFKIGLFLPISGQFAPFGLEGKNSLDLAAKLVNEDGGINGQQVEIVALDTQGSPEEAVKVTNKLIEVEKVDAVVASFISSEVLAGVNALNDNGIYTVGMGTSPTWMSDDWPFIFRSAMNSTRATPKTADMVKKLGLTKIATFEGKDDATLENVKAFREDVTAIGAEIVAQESYDGGDTDFSAQVAKIIASEPDAVYIAALGEAEPLIVKQLRQYGFNGIIIDKEAFAVSMVEIAGEEASDYIMFANPYVTYTDIEDCDIPAMYDFLEKYSAEYGKLPETEISYRAWDAVSVILEAAKIAKSNDSKALSEAGHKVNFESIGGTLDYTKGDREGYSDFNTFILIDGKNILFDDWYSSGGYDAYKEATGR